MDLEKKDLKLDVLVRHDANRGVFVGQCLQFDVAVQAKSMELLKQRFARTFAAYVMAMAEVGEIRFRPAPRTFWDAYATGSIDDTDLPIYVPTSTNARQVADVRATYRRVPEGASFAAGASL